MNAAEDEVMDEAVDLFLAMELHVADCRTCRPVDAKFHAAMALDHMDEVRRLVPLFCAEMGTLAERLGVVGRRAMSQRCDCGHSEDDHIDKLFCNGSEFCGCPSYTPLVPREMKDDQA